MELQEMLEKVEAFNKASDRMIHNLEVLHSFLESGKSIMLGKKEIAALCGMSEQAAMEFLNSKEVQPRLFPFGQGKRISIFNLLQIRTIGGREK